MTNDDIERRCVLGTLERRVKPETSEDTLEGYAALYNVETTIGDLFREVIRPGAFSQAIARDDVRALWNHDPNYVLGRTASRTLTLSEDSVGLRYVVTPPGTTWARDLLASVARGDVSQSSFGFRVTDGGWVEPTKRGQLPLREIRAVELLDVSPVMRAAYPATTVEARSAAQAMTDAEVTQTSRRDEATKQWRRRNVQLRDISDSLTE